ncbi:SYF2 splicing factor-domain-containing protein [Sphaerosporella brunnea]|uniref:Pre-mRNA-splicing factor SYF2 n=1 Tax=Sphaerosporella brunnea TaxID=1250544 RepID=A0A5J5F0S5_9PEZI|nr:SYF2 splicing factor-domain-containing protein [Sphaerosporella brunnea]
MPPSASPAPESSAASPEPSSSSSSTAVGATPAADPVKARLEKWKALQNRAKKSSATNLKEVYAERRRQMVDPATTSRLQRKKAEAEFKLAKAEAAEAGEDFERKRAWDWTVEESERWDRRMEKKKRHVEDVAFQDYSQTARKMYKRQMRELKPDLEGYAADKAKLLKEGSVVETEDGELVIVDRDGEFYADADSLGFVDNKPKKEAVDRLVADLKKAEDARMSRKRGGEDDDVTYINDKNKQFNQKLQRAYGKYTKEIRDSFERGTMI